MKRVALVGGAPSWKDAPFDDFGTDIWVLGNQINRYKDKRYDRIFEIHNDLSEHEEFYPKYLADLGVSLVVGSEFPIEDDHITVYPFDDVYMLMEGQHLTSSPAYMMGMAILEGYESIEIYGIDMAIDDHEYFYQRPTMYAWIAFAKAKGIVVTCHGGLFTDAYIEGGEKQLSDLSKAPFTTEQLSIIEKKHIDAIEKIDNQIESLNHVKATHDGARQAYARLTQVARAIEAGVEVNTLTDSLLIRE